jgi:2-iminobutanoate/2-iminopropanoate deaminase
LYRIAAARGAKNRGSTQKIPTGTLARRLMPMPIRMRYNRTSYEPRRISMRIHSRLALTCALVAAFGASALAAEYMEKNERQKARAFSPGVITEGGRTVWLAGQTALQDDQGKNLAGNFEGQARQIFHLMDQTLAKAGGGIANLVTMTVFINDPRNGDRLTELRKEIFPDGNYPGSALITVSNFAVPGMLIEVQGVAVIGDRCSNENRCSVGWPAR